MNNLTIKFIEKLIEKTKMSELNWIRCTQDAPDVKPSKASRLGAPMLVSKSAMNVVFVPQVHKEASYFCRFNNGYIFLLYKMSLSGQTSLLTLTAQTDDSPYSKTYVSDDEKDLEIVSSLKRLYNIIDTSDPDIDAYINEFLNS